MLQEKKAGNLLPSKNVFSTSNNWEVRHLVIDGEPWFAAKDICNFLGLTNPSVSVGALEVYEKRKVDPKQFLGSSVSNEWVWIVNESGLYRLIFKSRKPEAKAFQKWVVTEVLPSIRKTGKYSTEGKRPLDKASRDWVLKIKNRLVRGDIKKVAVRLGLSQSHVGKVARGLTASHRVVEALAKQAEGNHKKGIRDERGYRSEFRDRLSTQLSFLDELPLAE